MSSLPGDDVRVRDDQPRCGDPAGAGHAEPAGAAEHLHHAGGRLLDLGVARDARARRRDAGLGSLDPRERVEAAQRVQQRAGRRQDGVEPLEDRGALDLHPDPVAAVLDRERAEDPDDAEPRARDQDGAEHPVARRRSRASAATRAGPASRTPRTARPASRRRAARRSGRTRAPTASARPRTGRAARPASRSTRRARARRTRARRTRSPGPTRRAPAAEPARR